MKNILTLQVVVLTILAVNFTTKIYAAEANQRDQNPLTIYITGSNLPLKHDGPEPAALSIDRSDIDKLNPQSVPHLLATVPGLHVENSSARGTVSTVYLRGAEANYTLVLINGIKVNDPTNSRGDAFDFSLIDINTVERIEVVKGPLSSVYGSAAMAGVINIITRPPVTESNGRFRAALGASGFSSIAAQATSAFANGGMSVNAAYSDDGEQIKGNHFIGKTLNITGGINVSPATTLSFNARHQSSDAKAFPDASGGHNNAVIRKLDKRKATQQQLGLGYKQGFTKGSYLELKASHFRSQEELQSPGVDQGIPPNNNDSNYSRRNLNLSYKLQSTVKLESIVGLELEWEQGDSSGALEFNGIESPTHFDLNRQLAAAFIEARYQFAAGFYGVAGARIDRPEDFDNELSPRLGVNYKNNSGTYGFNWSQGFKLPSFFALGHPIVGNAEFQPETSETYDISIQQSLSHHTDVNISVFYSKYYDLIDFDEGILVARPEVEVTGLEVGVNEQLSENISLSARYTLLDLDIKNSSDALNKRPERLGALTVNWRFRPSLRLAAQANYIGNIHDFSFPTGEQILKSYTRLDTNLQWQINNKWHLNIALNNVLNKHYEEAVGVEAPGSSAHLAVGGRL